MTLCFFGTVHVFILLSTHVYVEYSRRISTDYSNDVDPTEPVRCERVLFISFVLCSVQV